MRSWRQLALEQLDEQDGEAEQSNGKINGSTFNKGDGVFRASRGRTLTVCVYGVGVGSLSTGFLPPPQLLLWLLCRLVSLAFS